MGQEADVIPGMRRGEIEPSGVTLAAPKVDTVLCVAMIGKNETPGEQIGSFFLLFLFFSFLVVSAAQKRCRTGL